MDLAVPQLPACRGAHRQGKWLGRAQVCVCVSYSEQRSGKQYLGKRSPLGLPLDRARYSWKNLAGSLGLPSHPEKTPPPTQSLYPPGGPDGGSPKLAQGVWAWSWSCPWSPDQGWCLYAQVWDAS